MNVVVKTFIEMWQKLEEQYGSIGTPGLRNAEILPPLFLLYMWLL